MAGYKYAEEIVNLYEMEGRAGNSWVRIRREKEEKIDNIAATTTE